MTDETPESNTAPRDAPATEVPDSETNTAAAATPGPEPVADLAETPKKRDPLVTAILIVGVLIAVVGALIIYFWPRPVPDLLRSNETEVTAELEHSGLELGMVGQVATETVADGTVVLQRPAAQTIVAQHSSVDVTYGVAPAAATVPDVTGEDAAKAGAVLESQLFVPLYLDVFNDAVPKTLVLGQAPAPGASWMTGRPVALAISVGPDDGSGVAVPDLIGMNATDAASALDAAGLDAQVIIGNPGSPALVVTAQLPSAGVLVKPTATVLLLAQE